MGLSRRHLKPAFDSQRQKLFYPAYVFWFQRQGFGTENLLGPKVFIDTHLDLCPWAMKSRSQGVGCIYHMDLGEDVWQNERGKGL